MLFDATTTSELAATSTRQAWSAALAAALGTGYKIVWKTAADVAVVTLTMTGTPTVGSLRIEISGTPASITSTAGTPTKTVVESADGTRWVELDLMIPFVNSTGDALASLADAGFIWVNTLIIRPPSTLPDSGATPAWGTITDVEFTHGTPGSVSVADQLNSIGTVVFVGNLPNGVTFDASTLTFSYDGSGVPTVTENNTLTVETGSEEITTFYMTSSATSGTRPFTFGHSFLEGAAPNYITADIPDFQADIKNRWPDGSVKFAIISGRKAFTQGTETSITFFTSSTNPNGAAIPLSSLQAAIGPGDVVLELSPYGSVDLYNLLSQVSSGRNSPGLVTHPLLGNQWLSGAQCSEWHFYSNVGTDNHLQVWFHVRMYSGGEIEIETIVENGWCFITSPGTRDYTTTLTINGTVRYSERIGMDQTFTPARVNDTQFTVSGNFTSYLPAGRRTELVGDTRAIGTIVSSTYASPNTTVTMTWDSGAVTPTNPTIVRHLDGHRHHTRWQKVFWFGTDPQVEPRHDVAYLRSTRKIPNYGWTTPPESSWTTYQVVNTARTLNMEPNPNPFHIMNYRSIMGDYGLADSIGWMPHWESLYAATGDVRAYRSMLGHARAHGRFMVHYRDETDGMRPIRAGRDDYRMLGITGSNGLTYNQAQTTNLAGASSGNGSVYRGQTWTSSHSPGAGYMAYLATGRFYFLEEVQFVSAIGLLAQPASRRPASGANRHFRADQQRVDAWGLRHVVQAYTITPDDDTETKTSLGNSLAATYRDFAEHIALPEWVNNLGLFAARLDDDGGTNDGMSSPQNFMELYYVLSLGMAKYVGATPTAQAATDLDTLLAHAFKWPISMCGDGVTGYTYRRYGQGTVTVGYGEGMPPTTRWMVNMGEGYEFDKIKYGWTTEDNTPGKSILSGSIPDTDGTRAGMFALALANTFAAELGLVGADTSWSLLTGSSTFRSDETTNFHQQPSYAVKPRTD